MYAADSNLEKIEEKFFVVLRIIRDELKNGRKIYDVSRDDGSIQILGEDNAQVASVPISKIKSNVLDIFNQMKKNVNRTFSITSAEEIMGDLSCTQIKASSSQKADLTIVVHDRISPTFPELGFSIKSMLGASSTLLNASGATNFIYQVEGLTDDQIKTTNEIDGRSKVRDRIKTIEALGGKIKFIKVDNEKFKNNLRKVDTALPEMIAEALQCFFKSKGSTIPELTKCLAENKELGERFSLSNGDYDFKLKNFLVSVALGMTPGKVWDGNTKAHGGYIIVKENGEIVCYHLYNRDEFQEYLFNNTKLDTPSTERHKFGIIYSEDGKNYIKLNLQIRFIR